MRLLVASGGRAPCHRAFEIALQDAKGKSLGKPVYDLLGGTDLDQIPIYGSGGCCDAKEQFTRELDLLDSLGIRKYKMRSIKTDILRTAWVLEEAGKRVASKLASTCARTSPIHHRRLTTWFGLHRRGSRHHRQAHDLRRRGDRTGCPRGVQGAAARTDVPVCGGEIITTPVEDDRADQQ